MLKKASLEESYNHLKRSKNTKKSLKMKKIYKKLNKLITSINFKN
jgi:hypothetical protein